MIEPGFYWVRSRADRHGIPALAFVGTSLGHVAVYPWGDVVEIVNVEDFA